VGSIPAYSPKSLSSVVGTDQAKVTVKSFPCEKELLPSFLRVLGIVCILVGLSVV
jgi:hypothetical protein